MLAPPFNFTQDQIDGAAFLARRRVALLGDKPGFGKTAQLIRAADFIGAERVTWICPANLPVKTAREWAKWELVRRPVAVLEKASDEIPASGVLLVSYDLAQRPEVAKRLAKRGCDALILDESHRAKDPRGSRARALFNAKGIASTAGRLWFATASPAQNDASEWYVFARACGAWTGTKNQFVTKFCVEVDDGAGGTKIVGNKNEDELKALLAPHVLARDKAEDDVRGALRVEEAWIDCVAPEVDLDPRDLADLQSALATGDWSVLDRPSVSTVRRLVGAAKAPAAAGLVSREIEAGAGKHLLFCQHTATIDTLAASLSKYGVCVIDGRGSKKRKQKDLDAFECEGSGPCVAICHGRSAGEGLDILAATRVLLVEPSWNPEDNIQMVARSWRRGQTKDVHASFLFANGTIDQALAATIKRKVKEMAKINMIRRVA